MSDPKTKSEASTAITCVMRGTTHEGQTCWARASGDLGQVKTARKMAREMVVENPGTPPNWR
jgi:hypothetical protein